MIRCTQCGGAFPVTEEELHPQCPFCGTALRLRTAGALRRLSVPAQASEASCRQAVRDLLLRRGHVPSGEPEVRVFHVPFLLRPDGSTDPAFSTHVPELAGLRLPAADWKVFDDALIPPTDVVVAPPADPAGAEAVIHYPVARAAIRVADDEIVVWIDAVHGRVLTPDAVPPRATVGHGVVGRMLAAACATFVPILLLVPFPWSVAAAAATTPLLYGWCLRRVRASA